MHSPVDIYLLVLSISTAIEKAMLAWNLKILSKLMESHHCGFVVNNTILHMMVYGWC